MVATLLLQYVSLQVGMFKLAVADVVIALAFVVGLGRAVSKGRLYYDAVVVCLVLLIALGLLSAVWLSGSVESFVYYLAKLAAGLVYYWTAASAMSVSARNYDIYRETWAVTVSIVFLVGVAQVALLRLGDLDHWLLRVVGDLRAGSRITSTLQYQGQLSYLAAFAIPILLARGLESGCVRRILSVLAASAGLVAMFGTGSRTGFVVLTGEVLLLVVLTALVPRWRRHRLRVWLAAWLLLLLGGAIVAATSGGWLPSAFERVASLTETGIVGGLESDSGRSGQYVAVPSVLRETGLLGVGLGSFREVAAQYGARAGLEVHSSYLAVILELGVPGLMCMGCLVGAVVLRSYRIGRDSLVDVASFVAGVGLLVSNATALLLVDRLMWVLLPIVTVRRRSPT